MAFLQNMKQGGEKELGHNPSSADLLPIFLQYCRAVVKARYGSWIESSPTPEVLNKRIERAIAGTLNTIRTRPTKESRPAKKGVWPRSVQKACGAAGLNLWTTEFGTYSPKSLMRPPLAQLEALLQINSLEFKTAFWRANEGQAKPDPHKPVRLKESKSGGYPFPNRAKWTRAELNNRGFAIGRIDKLDHHTMQRILRGQRVHEGSLEKLLECLNKAPKKGILDRTDIPND